MERTKPMEETKSQFQGQHQCTQYCSPSHVRKMKIFHQLSTKSCSDREDRKVTNDLGGYPTNLCAHTTKKCPTWYI